MARATRSLPFAFGARPRSLVRAVTLLAPMLVFGGLVNFGVAWWRVYKFERSWRAPGMGLSWDVERVPRFVSPKRGDELPQQWTVEMPPELPRPDRVVGGEFGWVYKTSEHAHFDPPGGEYTTVSVYRVEAGWPLRCVWGAERFVNSSRRDRNRLVGPLYMFSPPKWVSGGPMDVLLPIGVHPLPFIADALLYSAAPFALWFAVGPLRKWRRRRAGRCASCGYDRAGLGAGVVCPECGHA